MEVSNAYVLVLEPVFVLVKSRRFSRRSHADKTKSKALCLRLELDIDFGKAFR